jgi:hypothetical protein
MSLQSLNESAIAQSNNALYQTIRDLIAANDKTQKQLDALGLSIGPNAGLNAALTSLNLLSGQIAFPVTPNLSPLPNVLDDYREITNGWIIVDTSGAGLALTTTSSTVIKIGSLVIIGILFNYPVTANGANSLVGNLPYTCEPTPGNQWSGFFGFSTLGAPIKALVLQNTKTVLFTDDAGVPKTNVQLSAKQFALVLVYRTNE